LVANLVAPLLSIALQLLTILDAVGPIVGQVAAAIAEIRADPGSNARADPCANARPIGDAVARTRGKLRRAIPGASSRAITSQVTIGRQLRRSIAGACSRSIAGHIASTCGQLRRSIPAILEEIARGAPSARSRPTGRWSADV